MYAPVEGTSEDKMSSFYTDLQKTLDTARDQTEKIIIMGDWNSRIGQDINRGMGTMRSHGENVRNRNGDRMLEFCISNNLLIGNTSWSQPTEDRFTFIAAERNANRFHSVYSRLR